VLDLAYLLRGTVGEPRAAELVLVLGEAPSAFGVAIDGVQPLRRVAPAGIRPLTGEGGRGARLLRGITDDAVLVLSGEELVQLHY
jgi:chemotaxis signal transduction protein